MARCASCGTRSAVHYNDCAYLTPARTSVAASSVSDVVSDVETGDAAHGASQAVCYRELMTQLRTCDPQVPWTGAGGLFTRAADEIERLRAGIQAFLEGNYPNPRNYRPKRCPHDTACWDECGECNDDYLTGLLK